MGINILEIVSGVIIGLIIGIILAAIPIIKSRLGQLKDFIFRLLNKTPNVDKFEEQLRAASFEKFPSTEVRFSYYVRNRKKGEAERSDKEKEEEVYHFFTRADFTIDKFMAFLIPPLDRGHGRRGGTSSSAGLYFDADWDRYLHEIDERAPKLEARRIVFFDKPKLLLFIFQTDWVMSAAQVEDRKFKTLESIDLLTQSAREIVQYAHDVALIHQRIYKAAITCRYAAKSVVAASEYYDFGLYEIEGVTIVYSPIHYKDDYKTLAKEKVYVGNTKPQKLGIADFVNDFEALWTEAKKECADQKPNHQFDLTSLSNPQDSDFATRNFLTPEFFEEIYCKAIRDRLFNRLNIDITKISSLGRTSMKH